MQHVRDLFRSDHQRHMRRVAEKNWLKHQNGHATIGATPDSDGRITVVTASHDYPVGYVFDIEYETIQITVPIAEAPVDPITHPGYLRGSELTAPIKQGHPFTWTTLKIH